MIRGHFATIATRKRPVVEAVFAFPTLGHRTFRTRLLVDTGADRTIVAPLDADRLQRDLGIDITTLPQGDPIRGVGGQTPTRVIQALLTMEGSSVSLTLPILEASPSLLPIPSLLGRDIISRFALIVEERTSRVLLLDPDEADALNLP